MGSRWGSVPCKYALFFHRLSILERATDHGCIIIAAAQKRNVGRIQVQRPCEFFSERRYFKHMRFPAQGGAARGGVGGGGGGPSTPFLDFVCWIRASWERRGCGN
jgi:hypothetical protein